MADRIRLTNNRIFPNQRRLHGVDEVLMEPAKIHTVGHGCSPRRVDNSLFQRRLGRGRAHSSQRDSAQLRLDHRTVVLLGVGSCGGRGRREADGHAHFDACRTVSSGGGWDEASRIRPSEISRNRRWIVGWLSSLASGRAG